jgi:alkylated DNA nucleotide flippase Atl1
VPGPLPETPARVTALFVKPSPKRRMEAAPMVDAQARHGLLGDCHAQPLGPRQVLVVRQEALDDLDAAAWQLRANIAIGGLVEPDLASGSVLHIGDARVRITHACEICKVLREYVDRDTFRNLAGRRGALGVFLSGGAVRLGDEVTVTRRAYPSVPDAIGERVAWIIARIPHGHVLTYDTLLTLVGGKRAHFRVMPTYLRRAGAAGLPAHRVLTSAARLTGHLPTQRGSLLREGISLNGDVLANRDVLWDGSAIYTRD